MLETAPTEPDTNGPTRNTMTPERRPSVLIVEDELIVATDIQQSLEALGFDAFAIASSSTEAILRASERCPDVVLMDIRIKGERDGVQTAEILERQFDVPVVYLTAHADEATMARARRTGPYGYLLKPVKTAELRNAIEICLYRREMEKRLRERERWFSTTLESIADAVVAVDLSGTITFMNAAAEGLTGTPAKDAIGRPARDIVRLMSGQAIGGDETPLAKALREKRVVTLEDASIVNASTGASRLISDSAAPVVDGTHQLGAVMVFRDVTEQRMLRQQAELADRLASLGTMAAGVAHEINNPLTVVLGNAKFVADQLEHHRAELPSEGLTASTNQRLRDVFSALSDLQSAANRISSIVADLRTFSRPALQSAGVVNVVDCVEWAVRTTSHEFLHRARLTTRFGEVPAVEGDEGRLGQVFINLLLNAAHSIAPGRANANEVTVTTQSDAAGWAVIEVSDTGSGIPKDIIGRIFEPFFTTKDHGAGTGLGLSICHGIVVSLGGTLSVESSPGVGTTFLVRLPPAARKVPLAPPASRSPAAPVRARILVVDDDHTVLRAIARVLGGHDVVCVESGAEALAALEDGHPFDVIFSDVMMPTMTGMELYEQLLERNPGLAHRVVFLSGGAITEKIAKFIRSVPNLHIDKPFDVATLLDAVQRVLASPQRTVDDLDRGPHRQTL
ncbi:MAG TPA: response regulator [Polyangiaceae bacterium]